jgi:lysophospholipase L1-like esterase
MKLTDCRVPRLLARMPGRLLLAGLLVASSAWGEAKGPNRISLDDPNIHYQGIHHLSVQPDLVRFSRFGPALLELDKPRLGFNPLKARNTTGGVISFRTASRIVRLQFRATPGLDRGSEFGVYIDGQFVESRRFKPKQQLMELEISHDSSGKSVLWELTLPSFANPELIGFELEQGAELQAFGHAEKNVFVALGDSITHGTGQGSATHLTWPHLLSRKLDYTLYNLAVGGSGVSVTAGQTLSGFSRIDLITILFGYNDWNGEGDSAEAFQQQYRELLEAIRAAHPETPVFCITPLFTRRDVSKQSGLPILEFRDVIRQLVAELDDTDPNIHLISGDEISSEANLRTVETGDVVHLSVKGAALLAETLYPLVTWDPR